MERRGISLDNSYLEHPYAKSLLMQGSGTPPSLSPASMPDLQRQPGFAATPLPSTAASSGPGSSRRASGESQRSGGITPRSGAGPSPRCRRRGAGAGAGEEGEEGPAPLRILVAEDNAINQKVIKKVLQVRQE